MKFTSLKICFSDGPEVMREIASQNISSCFCCCTSVNLTLQAFKLICLMTKLKHLTFLS